MRHKQNFLSNEQKPVLLLAINFNWKYVSTSFAQRTIHSMVGWVEGFFGINVNENNDIQLNEIRSNNSLLTFNYIWI